MKSKMRKVLTIIAVTLGLAVTAAARGNLLIPAPVALEKRAGTLR